MTEKELYAKFSEKFGETADAGREKVEFVIDTIVKEAMENGKAAFGKNGTFKRKDVKATAARLNVENALVPGTFYDIPAKPARTKLAFELSKSGKKIGA